MQRRRLDLARDLKCVLAVQEKQLRGVLIEGPKWETSSTETLQTFMAAISKKKPFKQNRVGARAVREHEALEAVGDHLSEDQCTMFRAPAARANYLALDRHDCTYTCKELCRAFSKPTTESVDQLKHLVRYHVGGGARLVYYFDFEEVGNIAKLFVDTDFAGDQVTRRSTRGGIIQWGSHLIRHWSSTQPTVALSNGEAKLTGIVKGATHAIGFQSLASDMGLGISLHILSDATAAIGICRRRGLGKIRHLHVSDLWVQEQLKAGAFHLSHVDGKDNPADLLTKHADKETLHRLLPMMNLWFAEGRPTLAPSLTQ